MPQSWGEALQLLLVPLLLAEMPQTGLLARRPDWTEGQLRPVLGGVGRMRAALSACLRRAELPAPMAVHPAT